MIDVLLCLDAGLPDRFTKSVEMPTLLPIGADVELLGCQPAVVERYEWVEEYPGFVRMHVKFAKALKSNEEPVLAEAVIARYRQLGWEH